MPVPTAVPPSVVELRHPARGHLPERHRRRVLQMRASEHHDVGERLRLCVERVAELPHRRQQRAIDLLHRRDVHHRGECVVGRLAPVDVVVGMDRILAADGATGELDRAIGDHLVGVHVRLRARSGLEHHQRKLAVPMAVDDLLGRAIDEARLVRGQHGELRVRTCRRLLDDAERAHHRPPEAEARDPDRKIVDRALRLRAPQALGRHRHFAERVLLDPRVAAHAVSFRGTARASRTVSPLC
jgi:hypothetical protein